MSAGGLNYWMMNLFNLVPDVVAKIERAARDHPEDQEDDRDCRAKSYKPRGCKMGESTVEQLQQTMEFSIFFCKFLGHSLTSNEAIHWGKPTI